MASQLASARHLTFVVNRSLARSCQWCCQHQSRNFRQNFPLRQAPFFIKHYSQWWNWFLAFFLLCWNVGDNCSQRRFSNNCTLGLRQRLACGTENWCPLAVSFLGLCWYELRTTKWFQPNREVGNHALLPRPRNRQSCIDPAGNFIVGKKDLALVNNEHID